MSHFVTLVLLEETSQDIEADVAAQLAPYDENMEVPEYEADCHCIGQVARREAQQATEAEHGITIGKLRDEFHAGGRPKTETSEETDAAWKLHIGKYNATEKAAFDSHPMKDKPDPECGFYSERYHPEGHKPGERFEDGTGCAGTGKYLSTDNPQSKWDWYSIGGRWQGRFDSGYDASKDARNWETCWLCNGTGMRNDALGKEHRQKNPEYKCNGCQGKGAAMKHNLAPHMKGNIKLVSEILDYKPFAIVTPDGKWNEKGNIGWWGLVSDEQETWPEKAAEILKQHQQYIAVLCDLHI